MVLLFKTSLNMNVLSQISAKKSQIVVNGFTFTVVQMPL
ncbi:hypothetical protein P20652_0474 [Pseudoalteromonas sp. BSi20652]|nr:hypothetical protein P20652_0474 [Pseudoalteromonas sp. BSi20652]